MKDEGQNPFFNLDWYPCTDWREDAKKKKPRGPDSGSQGKNGQVGPGRKNKGVAEQTPSSKDPAQVKS